MSSGRCDTICAYTKTHNDLFEADLGIHTSLILILYIKNDILPMVLTVTAYLFSLSQTVSFETQ